MVSDWEVLQGLLTCLSISHRGTRGPSVSLSSGKYIKGSLAWYHSSGCAHEGPGSSVACRDDVFNKASLSPCRLLSPAELPREEK